MKTRKEDAASIVGQSLAEEIDAKNKAQAFKSDVLVEMSEGENPTPEETQELIAEAEAVAPVVEEAVETPAESTEPAESAEPQVEVVEESEAEVELFDVEKAEGGYGGYLVADRGDGKPALPTKKNGKLDHRLMGAAWAALHGGYRGNKYEGKGKQEAIAKLTNLYKREGISTPKSDAEDESEIEKAMGMDMSTMPYGGATSMKDAKKHQDSMNEMVDLMGTWNMFSNVAWNIMDSAGITDKKGAFKSALDEFKSMLAAKAMVEFSETEPVSPNVEKAQNSENHPLKPALDALLAAIDNSANVEGGVNGRLQSIQPSLQELGEAITDYVSKESAVEPPAQDKDQDSLLEKITELIQPISKDVQDLGVRLAGLEAKSNAGNVQPVRPRIPQPKTYSSSVIQKADAEKPKPGSLKSIVRKSVGIVE